MANYEGSGVGECRLCVRRLNKTTKHRGAVALFMRQYLTKSRLQTGRKKIKQGGTETFFFFFYTNREFLAGDSAGVKNLRESARNSSGKLSFGAQIISRVV